LIFLIRQEKSDFLPAVPAVALAKADRAPGLGRMVYKNSGIGYLGLARIQY
jgi:hypothetical protein